MPKLLVQIDQAGAEALVVAYLAPAGRLRSLFKAGIKSHVYTAARLFSVHWEEMLSIKGILLDLKQKTEFIKSLPYWKGLVDAIKEDDVKYYCGKKTCHSGNYDIGGPTFQLSLLKDTDGTVALPLSTCVNFLSVYKRELFPEILVYHEMIKQKLDKTRVIENLFGYPRIFTGLKDDRLYKAGYAFCPQSTVGCITHLALTEIQDEIDKGNYRGVDILQNGHDSGLFQMEEETISEYIPKLRKHFERRMIGWDGEEFYMKTEVGVGKNWMPVCEGNEEGMKEWKN